ncbi:MAG: sigma 54-interacting transcriptional regulator [Planctomycetota bacterium]
MNECTNQEIDLLSQSLEAVFLLDANKQLRYANSALFRCLNIPENTDPATAGVNLWEKLGISRLSSPGATWHCHAQEDSRSWLEIQCQSLHDPSGSLLGYWGIVTSRHQGLARATATDRQHLGDHVRSRGIENAPPRSRAGQRLAHQLNLARHLDAPMTFLGESGTGKLSLARELHLSTEGDHPFAVVDCEALTPDLQRQQLLGSLDVADLNAPAARGLLHAQGKGTLVLRYPTRLSQVLQEEVCRAFEKKTTTWRLIVSERSSLEQAMLEGRLIEDFYWLISPFIIAVPTLRERKADLPLVCERILSPLDRVLSPEADKVIADYDWPGNFRELETVLLQAAKSSHVTLLSPRELPARIRKPSTLLASSVESSDKPPPLDVILETVEKRLLNLALSRFRGNKSKAADFLGISRARLHRRCDQLGTTAPSADSDD